MSSVPPSHITTRLFARVIGPFLMVASPIATVRTASLLNAVSAALAASPTWQWMLGFALLLGGTIVVGLHRHWRGLPAVMGTTMGWVSCSWGLLLFVVSQTYFSDARAQEPSTLALARVAFVGLTVCGLFLTQTGWSQIESPRNSESLGLTL